MRGLVHGVLRERLLPLVHSLSASFFYDDLVAHFRAAQLYEGLLRDVEEDAELRATWWRMGLLENPKLRRAASRAAGDSDLIVFAFRGEHQPSSLLKAWIEGWPMSASHPTRLVALLQEPKEDVSERTAWDAFLREFAQRRGLLYLPSPLREREEPDAEEDLALPPIPEREAPSESRCPGQPYMHWGLNE